MRMRGRRGIQHVSGIDLFVEGKYVVYGSYSMPKWPASSSSPYRVLAAGDLKSAQENMNTFVMSNSSEIKKYIHIIYMCV